MLYHDYLKNLKGCPFCNADKRAFASNETAYLTFSRAPYHKHHLLVIPKRHVVSFFDIKKEESVNIDEMVKTGANVLRKLGYDNFSVLVRDGDASGKSIPHVHYHLIPKDLVGDLDNQEKPRIIMTEEEIRNLSDEIKSLI